MRRRRTRGEEAMVVHAYVERIHVDQETAVWEV